MSAPIWRRGDAYPEEWPQWLRDADIEWCRVEISEDGGVVWHGGIWLSGDWHGGVWRDGEWRSGHWRSGHWYDGTWRGGSWYDDDGKAWRTDGPPGRGGER